MTINSNLKSILPAIPFDAIIFGFLCGIWSYFMMQLLLVPSFKPRIILIILCLSLILEMLKRSIKKEATINNFTWIKLGIAIFICVYLFTFIEIIYSSLFLCGSYWKQCFYESEIADFRFWVIFFAVISIFSLIYSIVWKAIFKSK